ncbi:MAG: response regulator transcription factor [Chloroflexi bacterium]|uniref:Response regulator transcription factor n=2 Tax=Candidatus Chlorohelix allophototropha TaxID=3003348 RepID=A0A8T7LVS7_9CHLR|nr:response regulator transcription factor [Chloroflexota bacterium]
MMTKVLVVDDETNLVELVQSYLLREGYEVLTAFDELAALELARANPPDLVVLDLMLPGLDGIEVCRQLRQFSDAYVIILTAKTEEIDKIVGLSVGADDYLTKPFSPRELVARVKAMLRRPRSGAAGLSQPEVTPPHKLGDLVIDELRHEVRRQEEVISLTAREFALLVTLSAHPGRVFTRVQLLERVWGDEYYDDHVVDVHIANLRKKLETEPDSLQYIETVRGVGYRFEVRDIK